MANQALKVVAIDKAIQLLFASAGAVVASVLLIWSIYSFGYSRGEHDGSQETMQALQSNQKIMSGGVGTCIYNNGIYSCH